ncbi:MAG TPA: mobile mystery protein B [Parachlamydiaceae bacterium]|nr:mobile mystery protein B [Parachlamydiaceae bacterium]
MKFICPEGATPIDDISDLIPSWVRTQEDLNQVEVENISNATGKYLLKSIKPPPKWFNVPFLQKIHHEIFIDVWDWAGKFRTTQTCPGMKPYEIIGALNILCQDVKFWYDQNDVTIIEQAARVHHRLVYIHPYSNGNGRFSRLVSDRYLKACKYLYPTWPAELGKDGQCRKNYIDSLREADKGNLEPLISFMKKYGAQEK